MEFAYSGVRLGCFCGCLSRDLCSLRFALVLGLDSYGSFLRGLDLKFVPFELCCVLEFVAEWVFAGYRFGVVWP